MPVIHAETVVLSPSSSVRTRPMDGRIVYWAITSALAGFLFGFDTVVISGAVSRFVGWWMAGGHIGAVRCPPSAR